MPPSKPTNHWSVPSESAGSRLDKWLSAQITDISRTRVQQLIEKKKITVNGQYEKVNFRVSAGDTVVVTGELQPLPLKAEAENIPLDIVYEDDDLVVINKPAGMTVHVGAGHASEVDDDAPDPRMHGTLVNAILFHFKKLSREGGELRPGIVHRLDKDTSGLIIVAKTDSAHRKLAEQFALRKVQKKYIALVHGWPKTGNGSIQQPIGRDKRHRHRMAVDPRNGRDALSRYKTLAQWNTAYGKFSLLEVEIATGRTHQIRVHLSSIGLPIVGDTLYGAPLKIALLGQARGRAERTHTKANRNRAAMELARELTEAKMSGNKKQKSQINTNDVDIKNTPAYANTIGLSRQFLHAAELAFMHPRSGKAQKFSSRIPLDLESFKTVVVNSVL